MPKKKKSNTVSKKLLWTVTGVQSAVIAVACLVLFLYTQVRTQNWDRVPTEVVALMESAIVSLSNEAPYVPDSSYQYVPEEKLRFSRVDNQRIVYSYDEGDEANSIPAAMLVTSTNIKGGSIGELYQYNQSSYEPNLEVFDRIGKVQR